MKFHVVFKCEAGHEQTLDYGPGFDREYVEGHCVLMAGGHYKPIGRDMPGFPCGHDDAGHVCGKKLSFEITEVKA